MSESFNVSGPVAGYDLVNVQESAVIACARIIHAVIEALNKAHNEATVPWEFNAPSIVAGIKRALANPNETVEENHIAWMAYKEAEGWKYGPVKDHKAKTHPCMLPFSALSPHQQSKDMIFKAVVKTMFGPTV